MLPIENSRSCAGKRLYNSTLWFCSREFTALKDINQHVLSSIRTVKPRPWKRQKPNHLSMPHSLFQNGSELASISDSMPMTRRQRSLTSLPLFNCAKTSVNKRIESDGRYGLVWNCVAESTRHSARNGSLFWRINDPWTITDELHCEASLSEPIVANRSCRIVTDCETIS